VKDDPTVRRCRGFAEQWGCGGMRMLNIFAYRAILANAMIYYDTLLLSRVYEQKLAAGDLEAIKILKGTSPVAWRDVNLIGNFDFTASSTPADIEALAARL
jgi:hypothetical protein